MCNKASLRQRGSALIEVLIAAVVVAFALIALVHFQASLIENSSHAKVRALALSVAQAKLDDLRSFSQLPGGGAGVFGYSEIDDNAGGRENNVGALLIPNGPHTEANVEYTLEWDADDLYNCRDGTQALASDPTDASLCPTPLPALPPLSDVKVVHVSVSWAELLASDDPATTAVNEQIQTVVLDGVIHADDPALGALAFLGITREKPVVRYTPGTIPDVIPLMIGPDLNQESSKPVPDTTQHEISTETQFDVVQYKDSSNEILSRRDFVTVNCVCVQDGTGEAKTPARPPLPSGSTRVVLEKGEGATITKRRGRIQTGGQLGEQPFICNTCCKDHHDISSTTIKYDPFRPSTDYLVAGDHKHYNRNGSGVLIAADAAGAEYIEACRFQRINGELQVAQDWRIENLIVLPNAFLASNTSDYTNYIEQFVEDYVSGITVGSYPATTPVPTTALTNAPTEVTLTTTGQAQLQARGLYIDWMTNSEITALKQLLVDGQSILSQTRFFEVNLTRLANWSVGATTLLDVTNEPIESGSESTYSRGRISAKGMAGTTSARATIERSNTGLTDSGTIDPDDNSLLSQDDLPVVITGTTLPPPPGAGVMGSISIPGGINDVNPSDILVTGTGGASCTKPTQSTFTCTLTGGAGTVTFSNYRGTDPDPTKWHHLCPVDTFNYSGVTMPVMQNVNLKKYNQSC